ncbi:MAG: hypothetical protein KDE47_12715, partial [Caldilineaceae bacterium]|nr:hypothetical protein [Caldilineaceae bacterium]
PWTALPALPTPAGRTATTTVAPTFTPTTAPIALVPTPIPIEGEQSNIDSAEASRPAAIVPPLQTGMLLDI